jgi:hypothetical protein
VRSRVRPVDAARWTAGPNALRGSGPNRKAALGSALTQTGSPDPRNDHLLHYLVMPSPTAGASLSALEAHAARKAAGSLYRSPCTMMAQAIRAILLARATAATLAGRRAINRPSHGRVNVPCF